jgi:hypothetical protein
MRPCRRVERAKPEKANFHSHSAHEWSDDESTLMVPEVDDDDDDDATQFGKYHQNS